MSQSAENEAPTVRLFDVPAARIVEGAGCTWCGVGVSQDCLERDRTRDEIPHAQRWRDYWNATHDRHAHKEVHPAPWRPIPPDVTPGEYPA